MSEYGHAVDFSRLALDEDTLWTPEHETARNSLTVSYFLLELREQATTPKRTQQMCTTSCRCEELRPALMECHFHLRRNTKSWPL